MIEHPTYLFARASDYLTMSGCSFNGHKLRVVIPRQADGGEPGLPVLAPKGIVDQIVRLHQ